MITHCGEPDVDNGLAVGAAVLIGCAVINTAAMIAMSVAFGWRGFLIWVASQVFAVLLVVFLCGRSARQKP